MNPIAVILNEISLWKHLGEIQQKKSKQLSKQSGCKLKRVDCEKSKEEIDAQNENIKKMLHDMTENYCSKTSAARKTLIAKS